MANYRAGDYSDHDLTVMAKVLGLGLYAETDEPEGPHLTCIHGSAEGGEPETPNDPDGPVVRAIGNFMNRTVLRGPEDTVA
jgi:hypothetical protein